MTGQDGNSQRLIAEVYRAKRAGSLEIRGEIPIRPRRRSYMVIPGRVSSLQGRVCLCLLSLCSFLLFCFASQANELVNLKLHNEVCAFVKRLTARNLIEKRLDTTQPLPRREIAEALIEASEKHQSGQIELTDIEEKHLKYYQWLFGDEIEALRPSFLSLAKKRHGITLEGEEYKIDFDFKAKQEGASVNTSLGENRNTAITSTDVILLAQLGSHLGTSSTLSTHVLLGSTAYNPYETELIGGVHEEVKGILSTEGYIILNSPWMSLQWGFDGSWWGPGWHGALMLSDNSAPKDNLKLFGSYGPVKFSYFTAILRERTSEYHPKYMSAHRLEILPYPGIDIGFSEVMVFADRYELRYLNPFMPFQVLQTEDLKNNALLGAYYDITLLPSIEFYGEVMVDDFQVPGMAGVGLLDGFRVWNSKYGILAGGYWVDPLGLSDTDVRMEYAFVNQYAYTHKYDITRYTHQGFVIGHWMGTDADDLWFDIKHWLTDKLRISLTYERERQGEGDVQKNHPLELPPGQPKPEDAEPPKYWEFLSGITESIHSFSLGLSYASIGRYSLDTQYTYSRIENAGNELGIDGKEHQLIMKADYRF
jgi:hypothetical protein